MKSCPPQNHDAQLATTTFLIAHAISPENGFGEMALKCATSSPVDTAGMTEGTRRRLRQFEEKRHQFWFYLLTHIHRNTYDHQKLAELGLVPSGRKTEGRTNAFKRRVLQHSPHPEGTWIHLLHPPMAHVKAVVLYGNPAYQPEALKPQVGYQSYSVVTVNGTRPMRQYGHAIVLQS